MTDFDTLEQLYERNQLEPFIRYVRFPTFKNVVPGSVIQFTYPITALVGPNGTNKSSILRALQGCPNQYNIGDYWFDTPLDHIGGDIKNPHRYIHGYRAPSGIDVEVIKARVGKTSRGADYFETSAPRRRDGMAPMPAEGDARDALLRSKTRWKPVEKDVVYLDFRQELPAYDILMHFNWRKKDNRIDSKKQRIRRGGPHVARAIADLSAEHELYKANRILEAAEELAPEELSAVATILQRDYVSIRLVKHDYFGVEGYTASLTTAQREYSEAYAGSGEFAAIMMVRAISRAGHSSLILLDEPETSLHPGAQRELMRFIARMAVKNKHQVILATHSPAMVEELPDSARKLLNVDEIGGQVRVVEQRASLHQAFSRLGASFSPETLVVEDELAKSFVMRAARLRGADFLRSLDIRVVPGGADTIATRVVAVQAQLNSACAIVLDGDQRPTDPLGDPDQLPDHALQAELDKIKVSAATLLQNGGASGASQLASVRRQVLRWARERLAYLPTRHNPDALLAHMIGETHVVSSQEAKTFWVARTRNELGLLGSEAPTSLQILTTQQKALAQLADDHAHLVSLLAEITHLVP